MNGISEYMTVFRNYINNLQEFFYQKLSDMQTLQDAQSQQIDELTDKLITLVIIFALVIIAIIVIAIISKIRRKGKRKKEKRKYDEAAASLKREEERLREQRMYYEKQNRQNGYDDYGYNENKYGRGEYRNEWTPKKNRRNSVRRKNAAVQTYNEQPYGNTGNDQYEYNEYYNYDEDNATVNEYSPGRSAFRSPAKKSLWQRLRPDKNARDAREESDRNTQYIGNLDGMYKDKKDIDI